MANSNEIMLYMLINTAVDNGVKMIFTEDHIDIGMKMQKDLSEGIKNVVYVSKQDSIFDIMTFIQSVLGDMGVPIPQPKTDFDKASKIYDEVMFYKELAKYQSSKIN